jgi:hypothetical protein
LINSKGRENILQFLNQNDQTTLKNPAQAQKLTPKKGPPELQSRRAFFF